MNFKKRFRAFLFMMLLVVQVLATGCSKKEEPEVLTVNDESVSLNELKFYLRQVESDFEQQGGEDIWDTDFGEKTAKEVAKERAVDSVIWLKILKAKAKEMNLSLSAEEENALSSQAEQVMTAMDEKELKELNITKKEIQIMIQESILAGKVSEEVTKDFQPSEEEFQTFIQDVYGGEENPYVQVRAKHILLQTHERNEEGELVPLSEEVQKEAREKAEEALDRALAGEDFEGLVAEYSQDPGSKDTGGEYTFGKGQMDPAFEEAAFNTEPGAVNPNLIESAYGYHIIKTEEIIEPTEEEIKTNEEQVKQYFTEMKKQEVFQKQYEEWKEAAQINLNEEIWKDVQVNGQS